MIQHRFHVTRVLAMLSLGLSSGCRSHAPQAKPAPPQARIEVEPVRLGRMVSHITLNADVEPIEQTRVASGSGGKIDAMLVDVGAHVHKGQLLARVAAALAEAELNQARAALDTARASDARVQKLAAKQLASPATVEQSSLQVAQARAAAALAQVRYNNAMVRAPHDGIIAKRYQSTGEQAMPGAPLYDLVDTSRVKLIGQLSERDLPHVHAGSPAEIRVDAYPHDVFQGSVARLGVVAAQYSRTFEVEVDADNADGRLRPGMLARLRIARTAVDNVAIIRRDAVVNDLDGRAVFVAHAGHVQRRKVTLGPVDGDRVVVATGVAPGDEVVVVGQRSLVDGEAVKVVGTIQPAATGPRRAEDPPATDATSASGPKPVAERAPSRGKAPTTATP